MSQPEQSGFRFSLRNMMIVLTIAGVFCGVMGQLFVTQPRLFFRVWWFSITVVPFVLAIITLFVVCLLYTSPSPRDATLSRMPSSA